ncbi:MAG: SCP2 sterol-binding domain-containing protein [Gammaproteobacteria bacterium]|nr:SCP2 sterol-binding domain-containing protein [Gammaproteobacteria bacterium]
MKNTIKPIFVDAIQKALNAYIALDPESATRIQRMQGKVVTVELLKIDITFHLIFTDTAIQFKLASAHPPETIQSDTIIKGTPLRLLQLALSKNSRQQFFSDDVSIRGNLDLGQQVIELFDHLDIDWEEFLSKWVGDVAAHHLGRFGQRIKSWTQQTRETLLQDVNEYVHEEVDFFPAREALLDYFHDVDELRMDTDRVEAKIAQLKKSLAANRGAK